MRLRILLPLVAAGALAAAPPACADFVHTVMPGESLSSIAATDGLTLDQLAAANGLSTASQLIVGQAINIPAQSAPATSAAPSAAAPASAGDGDADSDDVASTAQSTPGTPQAPAPVNTATMPSAGSGYTVAPGDTLSAIAARAGISVAQLAAQNGLDPNGILYAGTVLQLSGTGSSSALPVSTSTATASAAGQPVGAVAEGNPSAPPYPTPERVSASEIGQIASANGVPPSLAEAIGWQESGFNNDLVSTADARGVMQILPGTWDWIQRSLTAGSPLAPASAASNVRGGVLLLHSLLNSTGGDPAMAAAGYYQGLSSVQQHGMYSDTQQYVQDVMSLAQRFGGG
jgi:LysM repeat protein